MPTSTLDWDLSSCLPELSGVDWSLISQTQFVFVGMGAVNRPLARQLAWLGMRRCLLVDPKRYKPQSVISQCEPGEVGEEKATVAANELEQVGVEAKALVKDVDVVPPGHLEDNSLVVVAVDNRRADICANRLAARMRRPLIKINVEPAYLTASIRCYDLRSSPASVCVECQMSDRHYEDQLHPLSCDGAEGERPTGSPRPLSQLAADAAALAIAQIVGSPEEWAGRWWGKQWQQNLLGGRGGFSDLETNPNCRWDHSLAYDPLIRLSDMRDVTLKSLAADAKFDIRELECIFSARAAARVVCSSCGDQQTGVWWVAELDKPAGRCRCGGEAFAVPFFTHERMAARDLEDVWETPLADWGVTPGSVITFQEKTKEVSYALPVE